MKKFCRYFCLVVIFLLQFTLIISCSSSGPKTDVASPATKITEPTKEPTKAPTFAAVKGIGTISNPIPFGRFYVQTRDKNNTKFQLGVAKVTRGEKAYQTIMEANTMNIEPAKGMEYVIVGIKVEYLSSSAADQVLEFAPTDFLAYSKNGIIPNNTIVMGLAPILDLKLKPGEKGDGYVFLQVYEDDATSLIVYRPSFGTTGEEYFFSMQ